jgi:putative oxidoreductase
MKPITRDGRADDAIRSRSGPVILLRGALWLAQILLALVFAFTGTGSLLRPVEDLAAVAVWPGEVPVALVRFIGAAELAGALGLILPSVTRIRPGLTPLAAAGLSVVMLFAAAYNLSQERWSPMTLNLLLGSLAAFVALGRARWLPIRERPEAAHE